MKSLPTVLLHHWLSHEATHSALLSCACTVHNCHRRVQTREWTPEAWSREEEPTLRISTYTTLHDPHLAPDCALWLCCLFFYPFLVISPRLGKSFDIHRGWFSWFPVEAPVFYIKGQTVGIQCSYSFQLAGYLCLMQLFMYLFTLIRE